MKRAKILILNIMIALIICILILILPVHGTDPTTEIHVVKYASDETTVLNEITESYQWMESNMAVCGDGETHYYHQGPVFDWPPGPWDENETTNFKDKGALKGTDIKDLCELVGGMSPDDKIKISAVDGYNRWFAYKNVYEPSPCQGSIVLCWNRNANYVPDFDEGMQIVFFADDSTNPEQKHVFGAWDMHESFDEEYRYNYSSIYPSANGLSIKWIKEIAIYSTMEPSEVHTIEFSHEDVTLDISMDQQFSATVYDQYGSEMTDVIVNWMSSNENVGRIDDTGLFSALTAGETTITAQNGTISATTGVTVSSLASMSTQDPPSTSSATFYSVLTTIIISPGAVPFNVGETQQFTATAYDQDHCIMQEPDFNWISSNETVGKIDDTGFFTALSAGDITIMVENGKVTDTIDITVSIPVPAPTPDETPLVNETTSYSPGSNQNSSSMASLIPQSPEQTTTSIPESPGYGSLSMIIGLMIVCYLIKQKKEV